MTFRMKARDPVIGVLALQGAVAPHRPHIEACGAEFRAVKTAAQIEETDGLILPGGESTTMLKLIERFDLWDALAGYFKRKPVWGICAGSILLAEAVENPAQKSFGVIPMSVRRNAYGRQMDSHHAEIDGYTVSFIRAPVITEISEKVDVLVRYQGDPVWVCYGDAMASTFHPELTLAFPSPMHRAFVDVVRKKM